MTDLFDLTGKTAIVTGASAGLGEGMAEALARAGANIVGVARTSCENVGKKVEAAGTGFLEVRADLASTEPLDRILSETLKAFGRVDILVNNAGMIRRADALEFSEKDWDDVLNVNLKTLFFFSQKIANAFVHQGTGGKIINTASMLSYQGGVRTASYTSSKSGVIGLTRLMANEWAKYGINVNAIAPGYMITNNTKALREDKARYEEILGRIPAGRWGTPEDLGGAVVFLASRASDYIHGFTVAVDGGWLAR
ncbi:MAG: 2-dehydro-3-deoxy-D-gluconate 5-dehydrogenase KduD [Lachnospiraceae bacterium]|jgi:2-deoxy-D-gluconate 3-dehydrogenase|nr:2-dehydro-3-deoxy-D-gluconate 5-dehydrogenase KduD [Lachnospiraceae bacterium]MCI9681147.1 2-dehydro-3-deoxy-D-gluconate 5-dehydrogenase KduD [Lachnospiraceae bacterium]